MLVETLGYSACFLQAQHILLVEPLPKADSCVQRAMKISQASISYHAWFCLLCTKMQPSVMYYSCPRLGGCLIQLCKCLSCLGCMCADFQFPDLCRTAILRCIPCLASFFLIHFIEVFTILQQRLYQIISQYSFF